MRRRLRKETDGFSLVEVILSLALLGIGAMLLVGFLGTGIKMLRNTTAITAQNADAAGQTETDAASGAVSSDVLTIVFGANAVAVDGYYTKNGAYICFVPA